MKIGAENFSRSTAHDPPTALSSTEPLHVVGIGASAGGLEALEELLRNMPPNMGVSFIVIQHLSPDYKSLMVELLSKHTVMPVLKAEDDMEVHPDTVYVLPPKKLITIFNSQLLLEEKDPSAPVNLPIDIFFSSLAQDQGEKAVGIILSGTGSDGTRGVRAIKEVGGLIMVQEEQSAKFDGMPRSAIATGVADFVIKPEEMPAELNRYISRHVTRSRQSSEDKLFSEKDELGTIFQLVKNQNGVDFSQYKTSTVSRRIQRRIDVNRLANLQDYLQLLIESPREVSQLCKEMLIGVTSFFRDQAAFEIVKNSIIPDLVNKANNDRPIRVWCGGCSTGEEAYSLGILFAEAMKLQGTFSEVKIFATDVDRDALEFASMGSYPESVAADIPQEYLKKYFKHTGGKYTIQRNIREMIVFAPQNITMDPPFTRMDFIICRNLLIYIQASLQKKVFSLFRFALNPHGYLFLGASETIGDFSDYFRTVDSKWKLYQLRKDSKNELADTLRLSLGKKNSLLPRNLTAPKDQGKEALLESVIRAFLDTQQKSCVVVNDKFQLTYTFGDVDGLILMAKGKATLDILRLVPKELSIILGTALHKVAREEKDIYYSGVSFLSNDKKISVNIQVIRTHLLNSQPPFFLIFFDRVNEAKEANGDCSPTVQDQISQHVFDLENDLNFTRENLQATVEELETSNEELQAANEELLSSNEELQSTNEELQSVNEELFTVNSEYQIKLKEMTEMNNDIENLMRCTDIGSVFLDGALRIRRYTPAAGEYVNILENDLGRVFFDLSHKLQYEHLQEDTRSVVATGESMEKEVLHKDGRSILIKIFPYLDETNTTHGVVLNYVDLTVIRDIEHELKEKNSEKDNILGNLPDIILYYDRNLTAVWANNHAFEKLELVPRELIGANHNSIWNLPEESEHLNPAHQALISGKRHGAIYKRSDGSRWKITAIPVVEKDKTTRAVVELAQNIEENDLVEIMLENKQ